MSENLDDSVSSTGGELDTGAHNGINEKSPGKMSNHEINEKNPGNQSPEKPKNFKGVSCNVFLLDGESITISLDKNDTGKVLFDKVCTQLNLLERDYFGLTYTDDRGPSHLKYWLNLDKKISKQKKRGAWVFDFALKFYPPDPSSLRESLTRWLVVLQVRRDLLSGRLPCTFTTYALLGSYNVQADVGEHDGVHGSSYDYIKDMTFAPNQTPDLLEKIAELHKQHRGQMPDEAERCFLDNAKKLSMYGVDLHKAKDSDNNAIMLGVCASGLLIYRDKLRINRFVWPKILKLSYKRNHFYIKIRPAEIERNETTIMFKLDNHRLAKRLWKTCVEHHAFFRLRESDKPNHNPTFPRFGSKFRYSGRTLYQTRQSAAQSNRPQPFFERSQPNRDSYSDTANRSRSVDELAGRRNKDPYGDGSMYDPNGSFYDPNDPNKLVDGRDRRDLKGGPPGYGSIGRDGGYRSDGEGGTLERRPYDTNTEDRRDKLPSHSATETSFGVGSGTAGLDDGTSQYRNPDGSYKPGYGPTGYMGDGYGPDGYDKYGYDRDGFHRDGYDRNGYDRNGFDRAGFDRDGYDKNGEKRLQDREGYDQNGNDRDGYDRDGLDKNGFGRAGFDTRDKDRCGEKRIPDKEGYDQNGFDKDGYDRDGFSRDGTNRDGFKNGFDKDGYNKAGFNPQGYDRNGEQKMLDREGYDQNGLDKDGYDRDGFDKYGFDRAGYDENDRDKNGEKRKLDKDGYDQNGFDKDGFNRNGLNKDGFFKDGFNRDGFDKNGYNRDGFKNGFDEDGYDRAGYDKHGRDRNGDERKLDKNGFDQKGYDKDGYNKHGFDKNGFDRAGYDKKGHDRNGEKRKPDKYGYDQKGFDKDGFNRIGLNRDGFDSYGFDRDGYDKEGYDRAGYGPDGFNREGCNREGNGRDGKKFVSALVVPNLSKGSDKDKDKKKKGGWFSRKNKDKGNEDDSADGTRIAGGPGTAAQQVGGYDPGSYGVGPYGAGHAMGERDLRGVMGDESFVDNKVDFLPLVEPVKGTKSTIKGGFSDNTMPFFHPAATSTVGRSKIPPPVMPKGRNHSTDDRNDYKKERGGTEEIRVEQRVVMSGDEEDDYDFDAALSDAIRSVTEFNPDMSVERIECVQQLEDVK